MSLRSNRDAYVAMFLLSQNDKVQMLFPHPLAKTVSGNYIEGGGAVVLPGPEQWYRLDRSRGYETLLLMASKTPLKNLSRLTEEMRSVMSKPQGEGGRGVVIRSQDATSEKEEGAMPTRQLSAIQTIAEQNNIEVVQAITYLHLK